VRRTIPGWWTSEKNDQPLLNARQCIRRGAGRLPPGTKNNTVSAVTTLLLSDSPGRKELIGDASNVYVRKLNRPREKFHQIEERGKILPADSMEYDINIDASLHAKSGPDPSPRVRAQGVK